MLVNRGVMVSTAGISLFRHKRQEPGRNRQEPASDDDLCSVRTSRGARMWGMAVGGYPPVVQLAICIIPQRAAVADGVDLLDCVFGGRKSQREVSA